MTFDLYYTGLITEPTTNSCTAANLVTSPRSPPSSRWRQVGNGDYTTGPITVSKAGYYAWVAHYSDDTNGNHSFDSPCDDTHETSIVVPAVPGIVTVVPQTDVTLSDSPTNLTDTATLSGASANATGSISFTLYGPFAIDPGNADCTQDKVVGTVGIDGTFAGNGTYASLPVLVTGVGYYTWVATYSGDADNESATHPAAGRRRPSRSTRRQPTVTTTEAQQTEVTLGATPTALTDKATLAGATDDATGAISFTLYGPFASDPGAADCTAGKVVGTVGIDGTFAGNGAYTSEGVVVTEAGYYTWVATYGGDGNNDSASHDCGQAVETTKVNPAKPTITTTAGADQVIGTTGSDLTDTATLAGGISPTGTISFSLYGPFASDPTGNAAACTAGNLVGTVTNPDVNGNGSYDSPAVTVTAAGYYVWVASYGGDDDNESATHACGLESEVVNVTPRQPSISTVAEATDDTLPDASVKDTATLSGLTANATGSVTFTLYIDDECSTVVTTLGPIDIGAVTGGTATVQSGSYTGLVNVGTYYFIASYDGDDNNKAASGQCGDDNESVTIKPANPGISTVAVANAVIKAGEKISDAASVTGLNPGATGTVTFALHGPNDETCLGTTVFSSEVDLVVTPAGDGTATGVATSTSFTPTAAWHLPLGRHLLR